MGKEIDFPEVGICGLSCRLCPAFHREGKSRCGGCKTPSRMGAGCPFITCAKGRAGIGFCGQCPESRSCEKWARHRSMGKLVDSFVCYQGLERNIAFIQREGLSAFEKAERVREGLLRQMLRTFDEGRSKTYYSIAATVMEVGELAGALEGARKVSKGLDLKGRSAALHALLDSIAEQKGYQLRLRHPKKK